MAKQKRAPRKDPAVSLAETVLGNTNGIPAGASINTTVGALRKLAKAVLKGVEK